MFLIDTTMCLRFLLRWNNKKRNDRKKAFAAIFNQKT